MTVLVLFSSPLPRIIRCCAGVSHTGEFSFWNPEGQRYKLKPFVAILVLPKNKKYCATLQLIVQPQLSVSSKRLLRGEQDCIWCVLRDVVHILYCSLLTVKKCRLALRYARKHKFIYVQKESMVLPSRCLHNLKLLQSVIWWYVCSCTQIGKYMWKWGYEFIYALE